MASAEELEDGIFSISWPIESVAVNGRVAVNNLPDVFKSCSLSYGIGMNRIVLRLNLVLSKTLRATKCEVSLVLASKDGIQQEMTLSKTRWTASWNIFTSSLQSPMTTVNGVRLRKAMATFFYIHIHLTPSGTMSITKGAKNVLDHISNLWKTKTSADVTFRCKGREIKAHSLIVSSCSPVLAAMFSNDFKDNREKIVDIKDFTLDIFSRLLRFMYVGDASLDSHVPEQDIAQLLVAANKYGVETLQEDCALHLSFNLTVENASQFLVLAHIHNSSVLVESTLLFMSKNAKAVCSRKDWMNIIKNYPELCFQATQLMFGP